MRRRSPVRPELILSRHLSVLPRVPATWRGPLQEIAVVWLALIALFWRDWIAMADQWWNASTYNHILVVPPILGWLVWLRLPQLSQLAPARWWPGILPFGAAMLLWMLGAFAGLDLARQAGAVAVLGATIPLLLGPRIAAGLAFPLAYLAFLVPFGDELVPALQMITAELTILLTRISAIPAAINGVFIDTPAGLFEVAEACSGVKFLVAMVALGALVANVCFKSWRRRAAFMALAVIAPIVANGVRAWGTIYVAQYKGAAYATGFDHIVYGWIFFALVIAAVMGAAWRHFDRGIDEPMIDIEKLRAAPLLARLETMRLSRRAAFTGMATALLLAQGWALAADRLEAALPAQIFLPDVPGWQRVDFRPNAAWEPRASGADHRLLGRYRDAAGREVDVFFALYSAQRGGKEAGAFGEGALVPGSEWSWSGPGPGIADGKSDRLLARGELRRLAVTYYRSGQLLTGSNGRLKLATIADRLALRAIPTAVLILSSEDGAGRSAEDSLRSFRTAIGPVDQWMDQVAAAR